MERPREVCGEDGQVGGLPGGDFALHAQDARGAGGEKLDHAHQRESARVNELFERQGQRRFKTSEAKGRFVELDIF